MLARRACGEGDLRSVWGGYAALPQQATPGDSRTPLATRCLAGVPGYVQQVDAAISRLVQQGLMLESARALVLARAQVEGQAAVTLDKSWAAARSAGRHRARPSFVRQGRMRERTVVTGEPWFRKALFR